MDRFRNLKTRFWPKIASNRETKDSPPLGETAVTHSALNDGQRAGTDTEKTCFSTTKPNYQPIKKPLTKSKRIFEL